MTLSDPHKQQYIGVRLEFGGSELPNPDVVNIDDTPTVIALTDFTSDVVISSETYISQPALSVSVASNNGLFGAESATIDVPRESIQDDMTSGPFAPAEVTIYEFVDGDSGNELLYLFRGWVYSTIRNVGGKDGSDRLTCYSDKRALDRALGLAASHQCIWQLFGAGCVTTNVDTGPPSAPTGPGTQGPNIASLISECTIDTVTGTAVTVDDLLDIGLLVGNRWQAGYLEYRGHRITIRDWDNTDTTPGDPGRVSTTFQLVSEPPASWAGVVLRAIPGCPKTEDECDLRYSNRDNFLGPGFAIQPYDPIIESP